MTTYNALIIDDHPLIAEAYKSAFLYVEKTTSPTSFTIDVAHDCDTANEKLLHFFNEKKPLDIVFLDMSLPASKDRKILSGEDLGLIINEKFPKTKIIVATTYNDNFRIHNILKNLNPDGLLIKNDISSKELVTAITEVIANPPYYSKTVLKSLRRQHSSDLFIDDIDRKILYELSIGTKLKDMKNILLSVHSIVKRKRALKQIFGVEDSDDSKLISVAKEKGFI